MAHINITPYPGTVYEQQEQALAHLFSHKNQQDFIYGTSFGQSIEKRRKIANAIKNRDTTVFKCSRRKGYWKIELAD